MFSLAAGIFTAYAIGDSLTTPTVDAELKTLDYGPGPFIPRSFSKPALCIVNGAPAVCFIDYQGESNEVLMYMRATDATGSSWGTPVPLGVNTGTPRLIIADGL